MPRLGGSTMNGKRGRHGSHPHKFSQIQNHFACPLYFILLEHVWVTGIAPGTYRGLKSASSEPEACSILPTAQTQKDPGDGVSASPVDTLGARFQTSSNTELSLTSMGLPSTQPLKSPQNLNSTNLFEVCLGRVLQFSLF